LKPAREHATNNTQTYFVTSDTWERRALFRAELWARLFFKVLLLHRPDSYLLHEFVLMPDHFHLLITPTLALERAVQLIKGGFSFRAKTELGSNAEIWRRGFADHRIRDFEDFDKHVHYIHLNPVKKHLCANLAEYRYSSAYPGWKLDPIPQGLKPGMVPASGGTTEVVPFQGGDTPRPKSAYLAASDVRAAARTRRSDAEATEILEPVGDTAKAMPFQNTSLMK
jgi:putative transposase